MKDLYSSDLPRRSMWQKPVGGKVGRPPSTIVVADSEEEVTSPLSGANSNNLTRKTPNVETRNTRNTQKSRWNKVTATERVTRPKRTQTATRRVTRNKHTISRLHVRKV